MKLCNLGTKYVHKAWSVFGYQMQTKDNYLLCLLMYIYTFPLLY
jgi:hypothetical protein